MGFVYLICDPEQNAYKIGITRNMDQHRIKRLQTGNASLLHLVNYVETEYPFRVETMLHNRFKNKKILGEWYALEAEDVIQFKSICGKCIDTINILKDENIFYPGDNIK